MQIFLHFFCWSGVLLRDYWTPLSHADSVCYSSKNVLPRTRPFSAEATPPASPGGRSAFLSEYILIYACA